MKQIIKIIIKGCSGYGLADEAYTDKITLTPDSINYEYIPTAKSEISPPKKWSYKTNSPVFDNAFSIVADMMPGILEPKIMVDCTDVGIIDFTVTYTDKSKKNIRYQCTGEEFSQCFALIKGLVPSIEDIPTVLLTSDGYSGK